MKTTLIVLFLVWTIIKQGHSDRFEVKDNANQVCMIVELDATFQLSRESPRQDALFQLKGATLDPGASSCGLVGLSSYLNMNLQPSNERLTLVFKKTDIDTVELNVFLEIRPLAHFPGADNATVGLEDGVPHLDVGKVTDSYMCMSEQSILFTNGSYGMTMTISNVHLQAFNVQGGTFSPPIFCDLDDTSSVAPVSEMTSVTEATTSEAPVTTQAVTTQSISTETTTVAPTTPPPVEHHFEVKDGDVVCFAMNATFVFHMPYNTTTGEAKTADIQVPLDATVSPDSTCDTGNGTEELIEIKFFDDEWMLAILVRKDVTERDLQFRADDDFDYSWHSVELTYKRNDKYFPNIKDPSDEPVTSSSGAIDGEFKAHTNGSYRCTSKKAVALDDSISLDLANMQYKAFGVTDSDEFSGAVSECPTPPPVEHHFEVKDGDVVCFAMNATFVFHMPYNTTTGEAKTADIQVPLDATVSPDSTCDTGNGTEELIEIKFFDDEWMLAILVRKDVTERDLQFRADDDFDYSWHSVELTYKRNDKYFPNIKDPSDEPVTSSSGAIDGEFKAHTNGSYRCTSKKAVALDDSISLDLANMQYKAFGVTDSDEFSGAVSECPTTTPGGDGSGRTIVIVVGATLGGLAVIALVAYVLFRQKRKDNPAECPEDSGGDDDDDHTLAIALGAGLGGLALLIVVAVIIWKVRSSKRSGYKDLDKQPI